MLLNLCASSWKASDLEKFDDKLSYLNWKTEMINKIQLNYSQEEELEVIKGYIFSCTTEVPQDQLQPHLVHLGQPQDVWSLLDSLYNSPYSVMEAQFKLQACKQKNCCFQEYYAEFLSIATKHNNFDNETLKTTFIQGLFNEIWPLMTPKLTKLMTGAYLMDKFYIWIQDWAVGVEHVFSFGSTPDYQQPQGSNNICFFTPYYPSTASAATSEIKLTTSPVLSTAMVPTAICNCILTTPISYFWPLLNKAKRKCHCDNNLCFYCRESDHWLGNCPQKHTTCVNEITFQTPPPGQLAIKAPLVPTNALELCSENEWSTWIITQKAPNQCWGY